MLFNSFIFILLFLPLSITGYFLLNKINIKLAKVFLLCMSLLFYAYNVPAYLVIIISSIVINYSFSKLFKIIHSNNARTCIFVLGLLFDAGILIYYKYFSFILWNFNYFLHTDFVITSIILPLGISFYTIQQISFLIDNYQDDSLNYDFIDYALFVTFFPQLVAGPIVYHHELISQFHDKTKIKANSYNILYGITWFTLGLSKKIFVADTLSGGVNWAFDNISSLSGPDILLVMLSFTLQIYFDFSGYSDMACGIAKMFNFDLPQNFNSPYKSTTIQEFWHRWHMTLTRFLTKYIYIPLGGNRRGNLRTCLNTMIVFLISGIWHGANFTFFLWGILHGFFIVFERSFKKFLEKVPRHIRWALSFLIINTLWLLFRASSLKKWFLMLQRIPTNFDKGISGSLVSAYDSYIPLVALLGGGILLCLFSKNNYERKLKITPATAVATAFLLTLNLITLNKVSIFLYFNF